MTPMEQIIAKCNEVKAIALAKFGIDLTGVRVSFDLKGRCAGRAEGTRYEGVASDYKVKFNRDMLTREAFNHVLNDTVPHEFAHVLCFMKPSLGRNHDAGWGRTCRMLGGSAERLHKEDVVYGKGVTYEYTTDRGHKVRLSEKKHKYIQQGGLLMYKRGMGRVNISCGYEIVGYQGKTLATPKKVEGKEPMNAPAAIERVVREDPLAAYARELRLRLAPDAPKVTLVAPVQTPVAAFPAGSSKASISRAIMLSGYRDGKTYEQIITAMIAANGYDRQLARATFKANASKVNIPADWGQ